MKVLTAIHVILFVNRVISFKDMGHGAVDCSMGSSSCESCRAAYPFCYWCDGKCQRYYGKNIARIECPGRVMYENCEPESPSKSNVDEIARIVASLKKEQALESGYSHLDESGSEMQTEKKKTLKKSKLMHLLKLLKVLAYLENAKQKKVLSQKTVPASIDNSVVSEIEKLKFGEVENPQMIDNRFKNLHPSIHKASNSDLDALIKLVEMEKATEAPSQKMSKSNLKMELQTKDPFAVDTTELKTVITTTDKPMERKFTQAATKLKETIEPTAKYMNGTAPERIASQSGKYCEMFEQEDECNGDQDCSWCNILELCVGRNKEDFKHCTGNKRNAEIDAAVSDESNVCAGRTSCASCTKMGKCYWCEKTKSCHIYPFFGFIPHNCPTNMWYYKECDVQLAIFIILFPLLMILLAMAIFYVCLRYCYYRKRTLKVQLFEKPEIFEKRKGKKVYFVGGDEEDEELKSEMIRKKYNLPQEKEPLISP